MERPLHCDDIVVKRSDHRQQGVVDRTHGELDSHQPYPGQTEADAIDHDKSLSKPIFRQFMQDGVPPKDTVLVRWQNHPTVELIPTSKLKLIDRSLLIGDIVKRQPSDAMSGVVLNTFTKCTLQPMCDVTYQGNRTYKGLLPPGTWDPNHDAQFCVMPGGRPEPLVDVPASELIYAEMPTEDDLVIYRDWVGRVTAITNIIRVQLADKCVVEIGDEVGEHVDGSEGTFSVGDLVKAKKASLRLGNWIYGQYNPNTPPVGTVISLRTVGAEIVWLEARIRSGQAEPPALLEASEIESADFQVYDRTRRPQNTPRTIALDDTTSNSEPDIRLNLRARFRDANEARLKYPAAHWLDRTATYGYDLNVFDITSFHTDVTIQWQDLSITHESSIDVVPDSDIDDEHAAWPGEIAHTLGMHPVAGEGGFEQPERVGVVQAVNSSDRLATVLWSPYAHAYFTKNDEDPLPHLVSHSIPPSSGPTEELSLYDITTPPTLNVRRGDLCLIDSPELNPATISTGSRRDVSWLGEIVDTLLNGSLVIRLGASHNVRDVVLNRREILVAVRSDGTAQMDDWDGNEADEGFEDESETDEEDWDEHEAELAAYYEDEHGHPMDEDEAENEDWESADEADDGTSGDTEMFDAQEQQVSHTSPFPAEDDQADTIEPPASEQIQRPPSYLILEGDVPLDHHFANQPSTETPIHLKRTLKEHKILRTSSALPEGVYIRTWEHRMDLLRFLIIGPTETPYANAPFVLDVYLSSEFPSKPPEVFFHSWPAHAKIGGTGRVNPNLYEDGKVCLSLLGTWTGNSVEEWSASRSTLLQVVVSLLGLVLVRSPYFNEAGYEGLVGTEESKRPSALYSERVFLRAKGFLISALSRSERPSGLSGLQDIIEWIYRNAQGPRLLNATIQDVEKTLENSRDGGELDGMNVMSKGACTSLSRVLETLRGLVES